MSRPPGGDLLTDLLKGVSRSFYLTLRVLPHPVRESIGLAYLLARATDTVADTDALPASDRLQTLQALLASVLDPGQPAPDLGKVGGESTTTAEQFLLGRFPDCLRMLRSLPADEQALIQRVIEVIVSGQDLDIQRFELSSSSGITALPDASSLDDYTYRVAGCVGEFWTDICMLKLPAMRRLDLSFMRLNGVRFGKGLQLVNILRDLPRDLQQGRCYLPEVELSELGVKPSDLLKPQTQSRIQPLLDRWMDQAMAHLDAGWLYTLMLPPGHWSLRLACAWPVLIGQETLVKLRSAPLLDPEVRVKVTRSKIRRILAGSLLSLPVPFLWARLGASGRKVCLNPSVAAARQNGRKQR